MFQPTDGVAQEGCPRCHRLTWWDLRALGVQGQGREITHGVLKSVLHFHGWNGFIQATHIYIKKHSKSQSISLSSAIRCLSVSQSLYIVFCLGLLFNKLPPSWGNNHLSSVFSHRFDSHLHRWNVERPIETAFFPKGVRGSGGQAWFPKTTSPGKSSSSCSSCNCKELGAHGKASQKALNLTWNPRCKLNWESSKKSLCIPRNLDTYGYICINIYIHNIYWQFQLSKSEWRETINNKPDIQVHFGDDRLHGIKRWISHDGWVSRQLSGRIPDVEITSFYGSSNPTKKGTNLGWLKRCGVTLINWENWWNSS